MLWHPLGLGAVESEEESRVRILSSCNSMACILERDFGAIRFVVQFMLQIRRLYWMSV